ncbi:hypothetical protein B0H16DRAFT_1742790 [Mycena metata]|uniref:Histidine kinase n=1 Tax=Mycena metata TaxID=1033252 RepID=A0AAD7H7C3_9AGAR|nr:hypothetical protein B0H16DRAFT_1742790 [Mycena metata]
MTRPAPSSLPPPSKKRKIHKDSEFTKSIQRLEEQLTSAAAANTSLNPLADLLELAFAADDAQDTSKAIYALYRVFIILITGGKLNPGVDEATKVVKAWIWDRLNSYVDFLCGLLKDEEKLLRISALQILFSLQKHLSTAASSESQPQFHVSHFRKIVSSLLLCPASRRVAQTSEGILDADVLHLFHETWFSIHDDVRWFFLREAGSIITTTSISEHPGLPANLLTILEGLNTFPTEKAELNAWWVSEMGTKPPKPKPSKKSAGADDVSSDEEADKEDAGEDDDWRKFFEEDTSAKDAEKPKTPGARLHKLTLHQSLHSLPSHRAVFTRTWLALLPKLSAVRDVATSKTLSQRALNVMHRGVMPHLTRPVLVMDWVGNSVDHGGVIGLLALNALFVLMKEYNLDYPSFYTKLYAFLDLQHTSPRPSLQSFIKRLARLSLSAPPAAVIMIIPFTYNVLKRHPALMAMIHRPEDSSDDPFDATEPNPLLTHAIESSLWELNSHREHYLSGVSTLTKIFSEAFTKPSYSMEDFLDHTYGTLFDADANRKIKKEPPVAVEMGKDVHLFPREEEPLIALENRDSPFRAFAALVETELASMDDQPAVSQPAVVSYVFPVRSLLSSSIQRYGQSDLGMLLPRSRSESTESAPIPIVNRTRSLSESSSTPSIKLSDLPSKGTQKRRSITSNFRHFPGEDSGPNLRRVFSTTSNRQRPLPPDRLAVFSASTPVADVASPAPKRKPPGEPPPELPARPKQVPVSDDPLPPEEVPDKGESEPWNLSRHGIVRLPTIPSVPSTSRDTFPVSATVLGSGTRTGPSAGHSEILFPNLAPPSDGVRHSASSPRSDPAQVVPSAQGSESAHDQRFESNGSSSTRVSGLGSEPASSSDASNTSHLLTVRFEHVQDEYGHHVIVGREGTLARCEDEPIRTPGAVQGFGVLIVVNELEDTLLVRQVSENAEEILGLPPRYLFSLDCFTDILPDSQAGVLWDNIQFLPHSENADEDEEASPHVFSLTGWGAPGSSSLNNEPNDDRHSWTCWCAMHRPSDPAGNNSGLIILEFELERDTLNPLYPVPDPIPDSSPRSRSAASATGSTHGSEHTVIATDESPTRDSLPPAGTVERDLIPLSAEGHEEPSVPSAEDILESTTSRARPLLALERLRRIARVNPEASSDSTSPPPSETRGRRAQRAGGSAPGSVGMMDVFAVMGQLDEQLGEAPDLPSFLQVVVGVIKDLSQFHRVLVYQFDEAWNGQVVAELLDWDKTHEIFRGLHFPAVDIPAQARKLYAINKVRLLYDRSQSTARIVVRSAEDLKTPLNMTHCYLRAVSPIHVKCVFCLYSGCAIGVVDEVCTDLENMGVRASMSVSIMASGRLWGLVSCHSYGAQGMRVSFPVRQILRLMSQSISRNIERLHYAQRLSTRKLINTMTSEYHPAGYIAITKDFDDLPEFAGLEVVAGMLYVPLSPDGKISFASFVKGSCRHPRKSFAVWSEMQTGRCRAWTDEQLETAGVLALVYGKFIEVWRLKENALQTTRLTNLLLSNASHEVRTPLNHIINYLEMALNGPLDDEIRDNLNRSHAASKSLLFTINDLLDLSRLESGQETSNNEPFNLRDTIEDATHLYRREAQRRNIAFKIELEHSPTTVIGDVKKIRTVVQNLTDNALKYTSEGTITVGCTTLADPEGVRGVNETVIEIVVADTGCGIDVESLGSMFREFEQVETMELKPIPLSDAGLGLAVVVRIVEQLGGQLRVESKVDEGSRFTFSLAMSVDGKELVMAPPAASIKARSRTGSLDPAAEIESLVQAIAATHIARPTSLGDFHRRAQSRASSASGPRAASVIFPGVFTVADSSTPIRAVKVDSFATRKEDRKPFETAPTEYLPDQLTDPSKLRLLVVEDNGINRAILAKRLRLDGHAVVTTTNGQEGLDKVTSDRAFDAILMDIQMPILDGFEATKCIRALEKSSPSPDNNLRPSNRLNGGHTPIFAVSASLVERQREAMVHCGFDGWMLKPIDFKRLRVIMGSITDLAQRRLNVYCQGCSWEAGGWLVDPPPSP